MSQETIERSFEVGSPARLNLSNIRGKIDLQLGDEGIIAIIAVKHLNSGDENDTQVQIDQGEDGQVIIKTEFINSIGNWFGLRKPCKVDYTIRLPKECELKVSGVSSPISVKGLAGTIDLHSVSGGLTLKDLSGNLKISVVSGSIQGEEIAGEVDCNSVSGSVRLLRSDMPVATLKTVSGNMVIETPLANGPYIFKGVSGNVSLIVPQDTSCTAETKSVSGRLRTSLPVTKDERLGSRGLIEIQGGGTEVSYKSVSGSLRIVTSENEKITEPTFTRKATPRSKDQMSILQKIERGEISVDEALEELNA